MVYWLQPSSGPLSKIQQTLKKGCSRVLPSNPDVTLNSLPNAHPSRRQTHTHPKGGRPAARARPTYRQLLSTLSVATSQESCTLPRSLSRGTPTCSRATMLNKRWMPPVWNSEDVSRRQAGIVLVLGTGGGWEGRRVLKGTLIRRRAHVSHHTPVALHGITAHRLS